MRYFKNSSNTNYVVCEGVPLPFCHFGQTARQIFTSYNHPAHHLPVYTDKVSLSVSGEWKSARMPESESVSFCQSSETNIYCSESVSYLPSDLSLHPSFSTRSVVCIPMLCGQRSYPFLLLFIVKSRRTGCVQRGYSELRKKKRKERKMCRAGKKG